MLINFDRIAVKVVAGAGLCAAAVALCPPAAAAPLPTGGYQCADRAAGAAGAPCAAVAAQAAGVVAPLAPPVVPPVPVAPPVVPPVAPPIVPPVPVAPPVPVVPPVPAGAPIAAPVAGGAPITEMGGAASGKGVPTAPAAKTGGPEAGVPTSAGTLDKAVLVREPVAHH